MPRMFMVITAHPDDAEFGAAGTVAKWISEGWECVYVVSTNGDKGSSDPKMTSERLAKIREKEQRNAAKVLGVSEVMFLGYPDGFLEDTAEYRGQLVKQIRRFKPEIVMAPDPYRRYFWHHDHRITGTVVLDAVYPYARDRLFYPEHQAQGLEPHKVAEVFTFGADDPDTFIDVSATWERKLQALRCHASQLPPDFDEGIKGWLTERAAEAGKGIGAPLAEGFRRVQFDWVQYQSRKKGM